MTTPRVERRSFLAALLTAPLVALGLKKLPVPPAPLGHLPRGQWVKVHVPLRNGAYAPGQTITLRKVPAPATPSLLTSSSADPDD